MNCLEGCDNKLYFHIVWSSYFPASDSTLLLLFFFYFKLRRFLWILLFPFVCTCSIFSLLQETELSILSIPFFKEFCNQKAFVPREFIITVLALITVAVNLQPNIKGNNGKVTHIPILPPKGTIRFLDLLSNTITCICRKMVDFRFFISEHSLWFWLLYRVGLLNKRKRKRGDVMFHC